MNPACGERRAVMRRREDIAAHAAIARLEERVDGLDQRLDDMAATLHEIRDSQRGCSGVCLARIEGLERYDARTTGAVDLGKWLIGGGAATALGVAALAVTVPGVARHLDLIRIDRGDLD